MTGTIESRTLLYTLGSMLLCRCVIQPAVLHQKGKFNFKVYLLDLEAIQVISAPSFKSKCPFRKCSEFYLSCLIIDIIITSSQKGKLLLGI